MESKLDQPGHITWNQKYWIDQFSSFAPYNELKKEEEVLVMTRKEASEYMSLLRMFKTGVYRAKNRR